MATRREIMRLVRGTTPLIGLGDWRIDVEFHPTLDCAATCKADPEYRQALLRFRPRRIRPHEVVAFVIHELAHGHTWTLASLAELWAGSNPTRKEVVRKAEEDATTAWDCVMTPLVFRQLTGKPCPPLVRVA